MCSIVFDLQGRAVYFEGEKVLFYTINGYCAMTWVTC